MEYYNVTFVYHDRVMGNLKMSVPIVNLPRDHFIYKEEEKTRRPIYYYEIDPFKGEIFLSPEMKRRIWKVIREKIIGHRDIEPYIDIFFRPYPERFRILKKAIKIFGLDLMP